MYEMNPLSVRMVVIALGEMEKCAKILKIEIMFTKPKPGPGQLFCYCFKIGQYEHVYSTNAYY